MNGLRAPRWLYVFLLAFTVTGVAHLELFPFSGFRLFSELRPAERESWQIRAVDEDGRERRVRLADLPVAYRNTTRLLPGFEDMSRDARDEICDAWTQPLRESGVTVASVRVYSVVESVRPERPPPIRSLAYECGGGL